MQRWFDLEEVPAGFGPSAVTIGNFDGVHRGHQAVLGRLVEQAGEIGASAVAVTFDPHPIAVLYPDRAPQPLSTLPEKLDRMAATGLDAVLVMRFTREFAAWSPRRFVEEVLVGALGAAVVVLGKDTRFGHRNSGDVTTMRELGAELGFDVDVIPEVGPADAAGDGEADERRWSSTLIRRLVAEGDVAAAAEVLGRPHRVTGEVVHGDHRGRLLGYPTANLGPGVVGAVPADGVYAGWLVRLEPPGAPEPSRMPAAISIGTNPTFDGRDRRVEAHVLDRDDLDLYGETVAFEFADRLRATVRFEDAASLRRQMADDVERCRAVLGVAAPS